MIKQHVASVTDLTGRTFMTEAPVNIPNVHWLPDSLKVCSGSQKCKTYTQIPRAFAWMCTCSVTQDSYSGVRTCVRVSGSDHDH